MLQDRRVNLKIKVDIWCGISDPHEEHTYSLDRTDRCSGILPCGVKGHEPHDMIYADNANCPGVCGCSEIPRMHSPKRHAVT